MEESRNERVIRFADMHARARYTTDISQDKMARELGVSKKTIQNWERGISSPTFFQSLEWFRILGINPMSYYLEYVYAEQVGNLNITYSDADVEKAFNDVMFNLPISIKRAILFILCGKHGSSPMSLIQLTLAHIHTPLKSRVVNATIIKHNYEMAEAQDELICKRNIMPDMNQLANAIELGKASAIKNDFGYVNFKDTE